MKIQTATHPLLQMQQTLGNQAVQRLIKLGTIQAKLKIGQPNDKYEQEADRVADQVMRLCDADVVQRVETGKIQPMQIQRMCPECEEETAQRQPEEEEIVQTKLNTGILQRQEDNEEDELVQTKETAGQTPQESAGLESSINSLKGAGQPLDKATQYFFEPRFGNDFSGVRIHQGGQAAELSRSINARAFTLGNNVIFGSGQYQPQSNEGKRLLGHELTHVVQQAGHIQSKIQLARLRDFVDTSDPDNDPGHLSDSQIEATNEYRSLMDPRNIWQWQDHVTSEEALLICRLILRHIRETRAFDWETDARAFLVRAREQQGTLTSAEAFLGSMVWSPFSSPTAVTDPSTLQSEFGRWLLAGGPEPASSITEMNCWEMVMYSAHFAGFITETRMKDIYNLGVANVRAGTNTSVGDTVESELMASNEYTFDPANPDSPLPLPGDMIIFNRAASHAAISLGTVNAAGEHEIMSLWNYDGSRPNVEQTTIEILLRSGGSGPVRFWSVNW